MPAKAKTTKKNPPKTTSKKKAVATDVEDATTESEHEDEVQKKKSDKAKKSDESKKSDEIELVAIEYDIPNPKHAFYNLHKKESTVDISKIVENLKKDEVSLKHFIMLIQKLDCFQ